MDLRLAAAGQQRRQPSKRSTQGYVGTQGSRLNCAPRALAGQLPLQQLALGQLALQGGLPPWRWLAARLLGGACCCWR